MSKKSGNLLQSQSKVRESMEFNVAGKTYEQNESINFKPNVSPFDETANNLSATNELLPYQNHCEETKIADPIVKTSSDNLKFFLHPQIGKKSKKQNLVKNIAI